MKTILPLAAVLSFATWMSAQISQESKPAVASDPAKQQPGRNGSPTLGFNHIKDVSPITDDDAIHEEWRLEKELPGNQLVHEKRAMHETILMGEFVDGFKNSKECNGVTFYLKTDKKPDFVVQINVTGHDDPKSKEQQWTWILGYPADPRPAEKSGHGMGGMGIQSNAKLTARDVCMTIWDDIDPNHFKKPGGKIEGGFETLFFSSFHVWPGKRQRNSRHNSRNLMFTATSFRVEELGCPTI